MKCIMLNCTLQGMYYQTGDIVSLLDHDGSVYYAQIRGFMQDQYNEKSAVLSWLLPTQNSPKVGFDPSTYILGMSSTDTIYIINREMCKVKINLLKILETSKLSFPSQCKVSGLTFRLYSTTWYMYTLIIVCYNVTFVTGVL